ncbi:SHOCT-like domain-containing protein [Levilinea saccharolytica]|nr:hypothetical protein [Levilinea saccharolytica]GAP17368.1 hypothetical protein LSAC_01237 [Levilinea saccharolytica]
MTLAEERLKVLQMVKDGKISAEDAAELLAALDVAAERKANPPAAPIPPYAGDRRNRWLRVRVTDTDTGKVRVNVRLPTSMIKAGMKMGMRFAPEVDGMDMSQLTAYIESGEVGQIVDVYDEQDGEHVEVFIE